MGQRIERKFTKFSDALDYITELDLEGFTAHFKYDIQTMTITVFASR